MSFSLSYTHTPETGHCGGSTVSELAGELKIKLFSGTLIPRCRVKIGYTLLQNTSTAARWTETSMELLKLTKLINKYKVNIKREW